MPSAGSKVLWRITTKLVAVGDILVPGNTVAGAGQLTLKVEESPFTAESTGHVFYLLDAFCKDIDVEVFTTSSGITADFAFGLAPFQNVVLVSTYRIFTATPPPLWTTYLQFENLTLTPRLISYKLYRWVGLD